MTATTCTDSLYPLLVEIWDSVGRADFSICVLCMDALLDIQNKTVYRTRCKDKGHCQFRGEFSRSQRILLLVRPHHHHYFQQRKSMSRPIDFRAEKGPPSFRRGHSILLASLTSSLPLLASLSPNLKWERIVALRESGQYQDYWDKLAVGKLRTCLTLITIRRYP